MPRRMSLVVAFAVAAQLILSARAEAAAPLRAVAETIDVASAECFSREALARKTAVSLQREEIDARLSMSVAMRGRDALFSAL